MPITAGRGPVQGVMAGRLNPNPLWPFWVSNVPVQTVPAIDNRNSGTVALTTHPGLTAAVQKSGQIAAVALTTHPAITTVRQKGALNTTALTTRPALLTSTSKGAQSISTLTTHPTFTVISSRFVGGVVSLTLHPATALTSQKGGQSTPALTTHPATSATTRKGALSAVSATTRPALSASVRKGGLSASQLSARPALTTSTLKGAQSVTTITVHPALSAVGVQVQTRNAIVSITVHPATAAVGQKTGQSAPALTSHPALTSTVRKGGQSAPALTEHPALAAAVRKGAQGAVTTTTHPSLTATSRKNGLVTSVLSAHVVLSSTSSAGRSSVTQIVFHPTFLTTGGPPAQSQPKLTFRPNFALTGLKTSSSDAVVTTHPAFSITSRKGAIGTGRYPPIIKRTPGVKGYWRLNEQSGSSVADVIGSNSGSLLSGVTLRGAGALNSDPDTSANFDGTANSLITFGATGITGDFTLECWTFLTGAGSVGSTTHSTIFGRNSASRILVNNALGYVLAQFANNLQTPDGSFLLNQWNLVHYTFDGITTQTISINGVQLASNTGAGAAVFNGVFFLGSYTNPGSNYVWKGRLDEPAIYDRFLTQDERWKRWETGIKSQGVDNHLSVSFSSVPRKDGKSQPSLTTHPNLTTTSRKVGLVQTQITVHPQFQVTPGQRVFGTASLIAHFMFVTSGFASGLAKPIRPINTRGGISGATTGELVGASAGDASGYQPSTGRITNPRTGSIDGPQTGEVE